MANYTIRLTNVLSSLIDKQQKEVNAEGFVFKHNSNKFIISVTHFHSISETYIDISDKKDLIRSTNVLWNELAIYKCPEEKYVLNLKIIKSYRTRFLEKDNKILFYINNIKTECINIGYEIISNNIHKNYYQKFIIKRRVTPDDIQTYKGLSGSPIFDSENNLIGIFCKISIVKDILYGYALPVIYLIKSLLKTDNENLYYLDIKSLKNKKISKYEVRPNPEVQATEKVDSTEDYAYSIYYSPINYKIPVEVYYSLEGDIDKTADCKNLDNNTLQTYDYLKYTDFDISQSIIKKDNTVKLNTGLLTYLISNKRISEYKLIVENHLTKQTKLDDVWLKLNDDVVISYEIS